MPLERDDPAAAPELDELTGLLRGFMDASRELTSRLSRQLGLGSTDVVALYLLDLHGPLGVAELAGRLGIRTASATALVDRLAGSGRVDRTPHPTDRRRTTVTLRESARRENLEAWLPAIGAIDDVVRSLPAPERVVVAGFLVRATAALDPRPDDPPG